MNTDQFRRAVARALGVPDKSLTLKEAKKYEIELDENGMVVLKTKELTP